jgi:hypothetical protein
MALVIGLWFAAARYVMFPGGIDFEEYKDKLQFASHNMSFSKEKDREFVNVVGTIKNGTNIVWRDVHVEARFFNEKNELVDTVSGNLRDVVIRPNSDSAFRVSGYATRPSQEYTRTLLTITSARSTSWMDR